MEEEHLILISHITLFITCGTDAEDPGLAIRSIPIKCKRKIKTYLF